MKAAYKAQLTVKHDWAVIGLILTYTLFGILSYAGQRLLSYLVLNNRIDMFTYQDMVYGFNLIVGAAASAGLVTFYTVCIAGSVGIRRAGFIAGSFSAAAPIFGALSTTILFRWLRLPSAGAGSVIGSAASAVLMFLPCFIMFILFAFCRKLKKGSRMLALLTALISLPVAVFPVTVAVLALVVMPGNQTVSSLTLISPYMIHLRPVMNAIGLAVLFYMNRDMSHESRKDGFTIS